MSEDNKLYNLRDDKPDKKSDAHIAYRRWIPWIIVCDAISILIVIALAIMTGFWKDAAVVAVTGLIGIAAANGVFLQVLIAGQMTRIMDNQEAEATLTRLASEKQAQIAADTFKQTADFFALNMMPAVVIVDAILEKPISSGQFPVAHLYYTNQGNSVALDVRINLGFGVPTGEKLANLRKGIPPKVNIKNTDATRGVIAPNAPPKHRKTRPLNLESDPIPSLLTGLRVFFIWGEIGYSDWLGNRYDFRFCMCAKSIHDEKLTYTSTYNGIVRVEGYDPEAETDPD